MSGQDSRDVYQSPLVGRYTSKEMQGVFSEANKFGLWRECWIALAESLHEVGLSTVTAEMVDELKRAKEEPIDWDFAAADEKRVRHDVMAHAHEFARHCPTAKGVIHLGATSMDVVDNAELMQQRRALPLLEARLVGLISNLATFAEEHADLVTLGFTHYQPAQPTTVGKRTCLYLNDLLIDVSEMERLHGYLAKARGLKGATGTQASFLSLFDGDRAKVRAVDELFARKLGFDGTMDVTGQTYSRKLDTLVLSTLAGVGASAHKFAVDLRLLANMKEVEEPFESGQVGSSAMAYKRNPMRAERMTSLARELINSANAANYIHANQWLERTLDDSAQRRRVIAETYLLADAVLNLYQNISGGLVVYPAMIARHLREELPFMATEDILMEVCRMGADRQEVHEIIRQHSVAAGKVVKEEGKSNDLMDRLAADQRLDLSKEYLDGLLASPERFAGLAPQQTRDFLRYSVEPVLDRYKELASATRGDVKV